MTTFVEEFFTYLSAGGTTAGTRFYPNALPQRVELPACRYFMVSNPTERTMSGSSSLRHPRYQMEFYADGDDGYLDAVKLANEVIALIDGYVGLMGTVTVYAGFREETHRDNFDPELNRHWVNMDVTIWHKKPS